MSQQVINLFIETDHPKFKDVIMYYKDFDKDKNKPKLGLHSPSYEKLKEYNSRLMANQLTEPDKLLGVARTLAIMRVGVHQAMNDHIADRIRELIVTSLDERMLEPRNKDGRLLGWEWNEYTSHNTKRICIIYGFRIKTPEQEQIPVKYNPMQRPSVVRITHDKSTRGWIDISTINEDKFIPMSQPIMAKRGSSLALAPIIQDFVDSEAINVIPTGYVFY